MIGFSDKFGVKINKVFSALAIITMIMAMLYFGASLIMPLVIAIFLWYLIITLADFLGKIRIRKQSSPYWLRLAVSILIILAAFWFTLFIITNNLSELTKNLPEYQKKITDFFKSALNQTNLYQGSLSPIMPNVDVSELFTSAAFELTNLLSMSSMVLIYVIFLLIEKNTFREKTHVMFPNKHRREKFLEIIRHIRKSSQAYIKVQTFISLMTGLATYVIALLFGLDFAPFWGLQAFFLNFIPFFGSVIATILPVLFAIIQLDTIWEPVVIFILVFIAQFYLSNILYPRMMGQNLNLSPIVILFTLALFTVIWGVIGAILSIPIMVIVNIILSQFKATRWIAVLLSERGNIPDIKK